MQGNGGKDRVWGHQGLRGADQPCTGRTRKIHPIGVFQLQNDIPGTIPVKHDGPPPMPGTRHCQTIIAMRNVSIILTRQRGAA